MTLEGNLERKKSPIYNWLNYLSEKMSLKNISYEKDFMGRKKRKSVKKGFLGKKNHVSKNVFKKTTYGFGKKVKYKQKNIKIKVFCEAFPAKNALFLRQVFFYN